MRALPVNIGTIHFVGIGGIGMSGIAEVLHNLGYKVQGSDQAESANVKRLRALGIHVAIGHDAGNLGEASVCVVSSAVKRDNPEVAEARARYIPVVRRAEMLAELMRLKWSIAIAGTHGKTTTTSLIGWLLDREGLDPTVINGGIINAYGTNARLGEGDWMVVEADESDGTFVKLRGVVAVVTNIDPEHMDHYGSFDALKAAFHDFIDNIPFYGFAALCIDHAEVQALIPQLEDKRVLTYGMSRQADFQAVNIRTGRAGAVFDVAISARIGGELRTIADIRLPMHGLHNVQNATAAIAVAHTLGVGDATIRQGLAEFQGVGRRFTRTGDWNGVTVFDDYGHHPVEIAAVLTAARGALDGDAGARVIAVIQPHRYSRLKNLFEEFCTCANQADHVIVAPVYAAGEAPLPGIDRDALVEGLRRHGHRNVHALGGPEDLAPLIRNLARPGDMVMCLGAGNITQWAHDLPRQLAALDPKAKAGGGA